MHSQIFKGTKLARVQHNVETGAKLRQRTFGLRILRIREDLVDHKPSIGVFFELQIRLVKKLYAGRKLK